MGRQNFRSYTIALAATQELSLNVQGMMYAVIESTGEFVISFDTSNKITKCVAGTGGEFRDSYNTVTFLSDTTQTVTVVLGFGQFKDSRASVNATLNTTISPSNVILNPGDVACANSPTALIGASASRKEVIVGVPSSSDFGIRVGNSSVSAASGDYIEPGSKMTYFTEAALYGIRELGATSNVTATVFAQERP